MNNVDYDPEFFDVDEYGNLIPKKDGFMDDEEHDDEYYDDLDDDYNTPGPDCLKCPDLLKCFPDYKE